MVEQASGPDAPGSLARLVARLTGSAKAAPQPAVVILTSRHRLWQRYGPDGVFAIERAVGDLMGAMAEDGLSATLVYADDSPLLTRLGLLPAETGDSVELGRLVRGLTARLRWTEEAVRYVLILGDDGIVPFHRCSNPTPDGDDAVLTDQPYGARADALLLTDLAVGRIPDPGLPTLLAVLASAAAAHRHRASGGRPAMADSAFGYSASVWKRAARQVFDAVGDPKALRLSPPLSQREVPVPGATGPRFRYYNLHGLVDAPEWFGQLDPAFPADYPNYPVALSPADLGDAPGSIVFSEACYGAHLQGRAVEDSMALSCLAHGSLAFVGATGVAYGGLDGPLVAADLLALRFWQAIRAGASAGQALAHAKSRLVQEALDRQGYVDAEEEKAVYNFVLYGDPSLAFRVPSVWAEDAAAACPGAGSVERAGPTIVVGTPSVRPHTFPEMPGATAAPPAGLVDYVRRTVARRLPGFGSDDVRVATVSMPGALRLAHGLQPTAGRELGGRTVVTLSKSSPTGRGPSCREVVRVTVDDSGHIRRVTISH
jgi:hypothetical protein